jgi:hypothetical protein
MCVSGTRVGIATSKPATSLNVYSASQIGWANRATNVPSNYQFAISDSGSDGGLYLGAYVTSGVGAGSTIQASDTYGSPLALNPVSLRINPLGGLVGIGTADPAYTLDVGGVINVNSNFRVGQSNFIYRSSPRKVGGSTYGVNWQVASATTSGSCLITYNVDSTTNGGDSFTVSSNGVYALTFATEAGTMWALDADLATTSIPTATANKVNLIAWTAANATIAEYGGSFVVWLATGKNVPSQGIRECQQRCQLQALYRTRLRNGVKPLNKRQWVTQGYWILHNCRGSVLFFCVRQAAYRHLRVCK